MSVSNLKDVFMANGASGAIWLAIGALCPRGSNILLPRPGFTYCVAADPMGVECRYYDCLVKSISSRFIFPHFDFCSFWIDRNFVSLFFRLAFPNQDLLFYLYYFPNSSVFML